MKVLYQDANVSDKIGRLVIISMLSGALRKFICPTCFCLVSNQDKHREATHNE